MLHAFRTDKGLRDFTGDILNNPKVRVIDYDGRLYLAYTKNRYDVIDLSLADSAGLSNPGGFAIVEKFSYTREAMQSYMRALKDGGVLSVTLWNKEEPPKSVLKLYATMAAAAREVDDGDIANRFFVVSSYLSTATVLYKRGGFTRRRDRQAARAHARACRSTRSTIRASNTTTPDRGRARRLPQADLLRRAMAEATTSPRTPRRPTRRATAAGGEASRRRAAKPASATVPATTMGQLAWHHLINGGWDEIADRYVFDTRMLTNNRPYFAAYVKPGDLPRITDRLELFQDEWGYLLLWATLAIACVTATVARAAAADLRLAHDLQPQPGQVPHHHLFRLPGRRLHHGRGRPDLRIHPGA